jgi:hypothetical protein
MKEEQPTPLFEIPKKKLGKTPSKALKSRLPDDIESFKLKGKPEIRFPEVGLDTQNILDVLYTGNVKDIRTEFENLGFMGDLRPYTKANLLTLYETYIGLTGSGRYRGGVSKKSKAKKRQALAQQALAITPAPTTAPTINVGDPELIDEEDPEADIRKNEVIAGKVDSDLTETSNMEDSTPSQTYIAKANELMISLIQFLGRTTVLYITKIKKNLNYLDEDQIKLIVENYTKLKPNLEMLKYYKNEGGAIIKETIYKQLTKETLELFNQINDSIRNVKKIKNYNIFSGAGMNKYKGGYFIQSDNPFIRHSTTKRFL